MKTRLLTLSLVPLMLFTSSCASFEEIFGDEFDKAEIKEKDFYFDEEISNDYSGEFSKIINNCLDSYKYAKKETLLIKNNEDGNVIKQYTTSDIDVFELGVLSQKEYVSYQVNTGQIIRQNHSSEHDYFIYNASIVGRLKEDGKTTFGFKAYDSDYSIRQASDVNVSVATNLFSTYPIEQFLFARSGESIFGTIAKSSIIPHATVEGAYQIIKEYCYIDLGSIYSPKLQSIETIYRQFTNYYENKKIMLEEDVQTEYQMKKYTFSYGDLSEYYDYENLIKITNNYVINGVGFTGIMIKNGLSTSFTPLIRKVEQDDKSANVLINVLREKGTYFSVQLSVLLSKYNYSNKMKTFSLSLDNTTLPEGYYITSEGFLRCSNYEMKSDSLNIEARCEYNVIEDAFKTTFIVTIA